MKCRLIFFFLLTLWTGLAGAASNASSSSWLGFGMGVGFTDIKQDIPGIGASGLRDSALQFTYFNAASQIAFTDKFALGLESVIGSELFRANGGAHIPEEDLTFAFDMSVDGRWQYWGGSWNSPHSFTPYLITGVDFSSLPALGLPPGVGKLYTIDRMNTISPVVGVGTGIYFGETTLQATAKFSHDFSGASHMKINNGHTLWVQIGYTFLIKSAGNIGVDLWAKRSWMNFDSVDPISHETLDNKYLYSTWGLKGYYKFMF